MWIRDRFHPDAVAAARCDVDRLAGGVFHAGKLPAMVAGWVHGLKTVADGKVILDFDFHQATRRIETYCIADIQACLLYTSDAADERSSVDLGGRRIIKKKKNTMIQRTPLNYNSSNSEAESSRR